MNNRIIVSLIVLFQMLYPYQVKPMMKEKTLAVKSFSKLPEHLENIAGLEELKFVLNKRSISVLDQEKIIYWLLSQKTPESLKGLLLYGPPGTGKSILVKILKKIMKADHLLEVSPAELQTSNQVKNKFDEARKLAQTTEHGIILFLDEIDDLAKPDSPVLNELLIQTAAHKANNKIFIIAATNYKEKLAPAFTRPGRFDVHILIPLAKGSSRAILLSEELESLYKEDKIAISYEQIIRIIQLTKGYSTAAITTMVNLAKGISQSRKKLRVDFLDFEESIKIMNAQMKPQSKL